MRRRLSPHVLPHTTAFGLRATALTSLMALGCSPALQSASKPPDLSSTGQSTCKVKASQEKPLIVEWPSSERGDLEALATRGLVVVQYSGCEMRVLPRCKAPGQYQYRPFTPKQDRISIRDNDELWAAIPMGAARFEGELLRAGQLNVDMTIVGKLTADIDELGSEALTGECEGATHALAGLTLGAFEFFSGAESRTSAGAGVFGVGAQGSSGSSRNSLSRDGALDACSAATLQDKSPPGNCGAILRVEVIPILHVTHPASDSSAENRLAAQEVRPAASPAPRTQASPPARSEHEPASGGGQTVAATPTTGTAFEAVRDPRSLSQPLRARSVLIEEISSLERLNTSLSDSSPDKAAVLVRIAYRYVELSLAARRDASASTDSTDRSKAARVEPLARKKAIAYFRTAIERYPQQQADRDAVIYSLALEYERSGDMPNARKTYYKLIQEAPNSRMIPLAYFAFGEGFAQEARSDPSKWTLAEQAFAEVLKYPAPENPVFALGKERLQAVRGR